MIDFRFDPFLFVFKPKNITGEVRTVQYFPAFRRVGFFLGETPQRLTTAPVSVICAGDTLGEVSRLATPGVDNFRVDYGNVNNFAQAGFVEIHTSRAGQVAVINYRGLGVNLNASLRTDARKNLQRSIRAAKNATPLSLTVPDSFTVNGGVSAGMQRIQDLSVLSATDLINLSTFMGMTGRSAPQILTGSGNWVKPANARQVFFVLVGPGGSGHVDGGGGGGGASVYGVADLDAIGGNMFAYVVGVVGIATTMFGCVAGAGGSGASGGAAGAGGTGSVGVDVVGQVFSGGNGSNGYYLAVALNGSNRIQTSPDGATWTPRLAAENNEWQVIRYAGNLLVAISSNGTHRVQTSTDGITWTVRNAAENNFWTGLTFGNGVFVAVAFDGVNRTMKSADGITWAAFPAIENNEWRAVAFGAGVFCAVSSDGTNRVMTSTDGENWTARSVPSNSWREIVFANSQFVAVGDSAVMTSPDGITWTARTPAAAEVWSALAYGNGVYAAASENGGVMTSPDGITWTARTPAAAETWQALTFGGGQFVAVGLAVSAPGWVMTSPDGVTWTAQTPGEQNNWASVDYIPAGAGGSSGGGLGGNGNDADCGKPGARKGFFSGSGGNATTAPESFGGGAGAGGTGADGLILLVY